MTIILSIFYQVDTQGLKVAADGQAYTWTEFFQYYGPDRVNWYWDWAYDAGRLELHDRLLRVLKQRVERFRHCC